MGVKTYIGGVGDELPEEDLLVGVESVDDEGEQLVDLRLEGERLRLRGHDEALPEREERRGGGGAREEASRVCGEREGRGMRWGRIVGCGTVGDFIGRGESRGSGMFYQGREGGRGARGERVD